MTRSGWWLAPPLATMQSLGMTHLVNASWLLVLLVLANPASPASPLRVLHAPALPATLPPTIPTLPHHRPTHSLAHSHSHSHSRFPVNSQAVPSALPVAASCLCRALFSLPIHHLLFVPRCLLLPRPAATASGPRCTALACRRFQVSDNASTHALPRRACSQPTLTHARPRLV
jgi:hypothetical protein